MADVRFYGTGRRKTSVARVWVNSGSGKISINDREVEEHFPRDSWKIHALAPLTATQTLEKVDVVADVKGGGLTGQAGAVRLGIARALVKMDETLKSSLKSAGHLTRDSRMVERKKYGLKKARKGSQFSKR